MLVFSSHHRNQSTSCLSHDRASRRGSLIRRAPLELRRESSSSGPAGVSSSRDTDTASMSVSFGKVRIHEHGLTLGDNPSVSCGIPLQLNWEADDSLTFDCLEQYEKEKKSVAPATGRLTAAMREEIARLDHSQGTLEKVEEEVLQIQGTREKEKQEYKERRRRHRLRRKARKQAAGSHGNWL